MLSKRFLRMLIVADLLLMIAARIAVFSTESYLPEPSFPRVAFGGYPLPSEWAPWLVFGIPLLIIAIESYIGLFVFWPPARPLYFITSVAAILLAPSFCPYIESGSSLMIAEAASMLNGVILALVYFSPLKELYEPEKR
jgi:hypothetical protein